MTTPASAAPAPSTPAPADRIDRAAAVLAAPLPTTEPALTQEIHRRSEEVESILAAPPPAVEERVTDDLDIRHFEIRGIERPGRVYSTMAHDGTDRRIVAFNEPVPRSELYDAEGKPKLSTHWSGMPILFLYVSGFEEALSLAREIAAAHRAGDVSAYVARHARELAEIRSGRAKGTK